MSFSTIVEGFDHPDDPDVAIQFTTKRETGMNSHTCIDLTQEEAEKLLVELQGVVE